MNTVDGRNPAPADMVHITYPIFYRVFKSQVVQDFFHQQYDSFISWPVLCFYLKIIFLNPSWWKSLEFSSPQKKSGVYFLLGIGLEMQWRSHTSCLQRHGRCGAPSKPPRKVGSKVLRACVTTEDPSAAETYAEILKTPGEVGDLWMEIWKQSFTSGNEQQKRQNTRGFKKLMVLEDEISLEILGCHLFEVRTVVSVLQG